MIRRPPRSTRTATLFPDTALYRSTPDKVWLVPRGSVLWLPAGTPHRSLAPEERLMRSLYVRPDSADVLPAAPTAVEQGTPLADMVTWLAEPYEQNGRASCRDRVCQYG